MKKKIAGILVILLLVIAGTAAVTQSWKNSREQAEQEERGTGTGQTGAAKKAG